MNTYLLMAMMVLAALALTGCALLPRGAAGAAAAPVTAAPEVLVARYTATPVALSGKLDDPAWQNAPVYELMLGADRGGGAPVERGEARLLWGEEFLYVGVKFYDSDVVQEDDRDQQHFYRTGDLVEVFLKPENSTWYWEIYGTPNSRRTVFWFPGPGRRLPSTFEKYPMDDLRVAAHVQGTLNDWRDRDEYWTAELAIPIKELTQHGDAFGPGAAWRILIARYNYSIHLRECELSMRPRLSKTSYHLLEEYAVLRLEK